VVNDVIRTQSRIEATLGALERLAQGELSTADDHVTVDITELLSTPQVLENGWRPRAPRVEIDRMATLRVGARTFWVHTRDVSQGGVKIETDQTFEVDTAVVVTLEHFRPLSGTVRWQKDRACGIAFNALIPFDQLIDWLKHGG